MIVLRVIDAMLIQAPPSSRDLVPGSTPFILHAAKAWIPAPSAGMQAGCGMNSGASS